MPLGQRIKFLLDHFNLSARKFSREIGVPENNTQNYLPPSTREPGAKYLELIALRFEGINPDWLLTGRGEAFNSNVAEGRTIYQTSHKNSGSQIIGHVGGNATNNQNASAAELTAARRELALLHAQLADKERTIQILLGKIPGH